MKLILEDGRGIPDATSYIDESFVTDFLPSEPLSDWKELSADEKIDRLITASLFIDTNYQWIGEQSTPEQGLSWPRRGVSYRGYPLNPFSIPRQIKRACVMAVQLLMEQGLQIFQSTGEAGVKKEKLGPMEMEYFQKHSQVINGISDFDDINKLLKGLYMQAGSGVLTAEVLRV